MLAIFMINMVKITRNILILFIKIYVLGCSIIYLIISAFTLIAVPSLKTAHAAEIKETITLEIQKNL